MQAWIEKEAATAAFGDKRLNARFQVVLDRLSQKPSLKFPAACKGRAEIAGAYRFVDNAKVTAPKVLAPHCHATLERIRQQPVVIVAQDTTKTDITRRHEKMAGAGPLNDANRWGFYNHVLLALTPERLPLGVINADIWARDPEEFQKSAEAKRQQRKAQPIEEKESYRWLEGYRDACRVAQEAPETHIICVADSEGDIYECLLAGQPDDELRRADWIIRAGQNRQVTATDAVADDVALKLREQVAATPVRTRLEVDVSARDGKSNETRKRKQPRRARRAQLTVQATRLRLHGPKRLGGRLPDLEVNVVLVREVNPPAGEEPIEWLLLTSLPIDTVAAVERVIEYYCCRWQIEIYFRVFKSGCQVEKSQLETAARFEPYVALCLIVAWRVLYVLMLGRECPDLPCDVVFDADEWRAVYAVVKEEAPPATPPSLGELVVLLAQLGGYQGRPSDGEPGPKALWIGLQRMTDLVLGWRAFPKYASARAPTDPETCVVR